MRVILVTLLLTSCASMPPAAEPAPAPTCPPARYEVTVPQFASCWTICGKKEKLKSITETMCLCTDGRRYLHGFAAAAGTSTVANSVAAPSAPAPAPAPAATPAASTPEAPPAETPPPAEAKAETAKEKEPEPPKPSESIFDMAKRLFD